MVQEVVSKKNYERRPAVGELFAASGGAGLDASVSQPRAGQLVEPAHFIRKFVTQQEHTYTRGEDSAAVY